MNIDVITMQPFSQPIMLIAPVFSVIAGLFVLVTFGLVICQVYVNTYNEYPDSATHTLRRTFARPRVWILIVLVVTSMVATYVVLAKSYSPLLMTSDSRVDQAAQRTYGVTLDSTGTRCQGNWTRCDQPDILVKTADGQRMMVSYVRTGEATEHGQPAVLLDRNGRELPRVASSR